MSTYTLDDEIILEEDNIQVTKSFSADELAVPVIRLRITSEHDTARNIQVTDTLPPSFSMDDIGFHPKYDKDRWTAYQDGQIVYERTISPGETVETVYGIRIDDPDEASPFMRTPELTVSENKSDIEAPAQEAITSIEDIAPIEQSQSVKDMLSTTGPGESAVEQSSTTIPEATSQSQSGSPDVAQHASSSNPSAEADTSSSSTLVSDITDEIQSGEVDEDEIEQLREALGLEVSRSVNAKIDHLQKRVENIAAYESALEKLVDAARDDTLADLEKNTSELAKEVNRLDRRLDEIETKLSERDVNTRLDSLAADVNRLEAEFESDDLPDAQEVDELATQVDNLTETIDQQQEQLDEFRAWREQLSDMFSE